MKLQSYLLFPAFFPFVLNFRVLGIFPYPGYSHFIMFRRLMTGLAKAGHNVDIVSHFPLLEQTERYTDLSIRGFWPMYFNNVSSEFMLENLNGRYRVIKFVMRTIGIDLCRMFLKIPMTQKLWNSVGKYDLVITHLLGSSCYLIIGEKLSVPTISISTSINVPWGNDRIDNPDNPSYMPVYCTHYSSKMTFIERLGNTLTLVVNKIWYVYTRITVNKEIQEGYYKNASDLYGLEKDTSLIFSNTHFTVNSVRPMVPSIEEVSGLHIALSSNLTLQGLEQILNVTSTQKYKGVIFFSLGSMVLTETLPREKLVALFDAFSELPYVVLWKADRKNMPSDITAPSNIHFEKWVPQSDVLCYPSVKLFVTHGGLMGTQEALYCGVPCLGIPLFADQELNVKSLEAHGLALSVDYETFTKEDILTTAKELLYNPKFKENADSASNRFRDRPLSPLETAIYWVEYVIRNNGTRHLRSPGADLNWVQYHLLDVGASLAIGTLGIFCISYKFVILLLKILCGFKIGTQTKNK